MAANVRGYSPVDVRLVERVRVAQPPADHLQEALASVDADRVGGSAPALLHPVVELRDLAVSAGRVVREHVRRPPVGPEVRWRSWHGLVMESPDIRSRVRGRAKSRRHEVEAAGRREPEGGTVEGKAHDVRAELPPPALRRLDSLEVPAVRAHQDRLALPGVALAQERNLVLGPVEGAPRIR